LATACLGRDDRRARTLFDEVTVEHDLREAWLGLAASLSRLGKPDNAADAIARALSRHIHQPDMNAIAAGIARSIQAAGWCGLSAAGEVVAYPFNSGPLNLVLDGQRVAARGLPVDWPRHGQLDVMIGEQPLLGSPIDLRAISRTTGYVAADRGGLRGWAWHPGDPTTDPVLTIDDGSGRPPLRMMATDRDVSVPDTGPLAHPRGFAVPAEALRSMTGALHVRGRDGRDLPGSPLDPRAEALAATSAALTLARLYPASARGEPPPDMAPPPAVPADLPVPDTLIGLDRRRRPIDIVVPVHGQPTLVLACLETLFASISRPNRIVVVDDASTEPALIAELDRLARARRIRLIRNARNLGFPGSANLGIIAASGRDVVLLNSDTLVPPNWLERLRDAAHADDNIGTVTPLSNNASILSYPGPGPANDIPDLAGTIALDRQAFRANRGETVDIPVGVGFCLYIRRDCLNATGRLRDDVFAQGYGEENDFCLRARRLGWRHVALPGLFVAHASGKSFGASAIHLRARNQDILNRLHPGYDRLIQDFTTADPLADARRRIDQERWRGARTPRQATAILITHDDGGGVEQRIARAVEDHARAGRQTVVLRPSQMGDGETAIVVSRGADRTFPNLRYRMPDEVPLLLRWLRTQHPDRLEAHHFLGHHPAIHDLIARLGVPYEAHVHDYAWFCPRISLVGGQDRYCGEPDRQTCQSCVDDHGSFLSEPITVADLTARSGAFLRSARQVIAPSRDAANRIRRHFPGIVPDIVPHEDDAAIVWRPRPPSRPAGRLRVCVLGGIGLHKGYDVLLACARNAADRALDLEFVVVGSTIDDARMLATGRVFVTGTYAPQEAVGLIDAQQPSLGFLPSIWPETWCMALSDLWRAGLRVAAFDLGAPAERIRHTGRGILLPLHLSAGAINDVLIASTTSYTAPANRTHARTVPTSDKSSVAIQTL
jgi:GT2 family glycosyltransferase/glycosyltransferase involved in cell wall biosynthesis